MTKQYITKQRIMELLDVKVMRLTDISNRLGLSVTTISAHLNELINLGYVDRIGRYYQKQNAQIHQHPKEDIPLQTRKGQK